MPNTAVVADRWKQANTVGDCTHYFDEKRLCETCGRPFLFFAEEQKHWYEELGFNLSADCLICPECRKVAHGLRCAQRRYEKLHALTESSDEENLEFAEIAIDLIKAKCFGPRAAERARMFLNRCSPTCKQSERFLDARARLNEVAPP